MSVRSGPRGVGKGGSRTTYDSIVQKQASSVGTIGTVSEAPKAPTKKPLSVNTLMGQAHGDSSNTVAFAEGFKNQAMDYQGIVNHDYQHKAIANIAMEKAFAGDWAGAGQIIQENPARFAGNIAFEAATAAIPVGTVMKSTKVGRMIAQQAVPRATQFVRSAAVDVVRNVGGAGLYAADVISSKIPFLKPAFAQGVNVTPESYIADVGYESAERSLRRSIGNQDDDIARISREIDEIDNAPPEVRKALAIERADLVNEAENVLGLDKQFTKSAHAPRSHSPTYLEMPRGENFELLTSTIQKLPTPLRTSRAIAGEQTMAEEIMKHPYINKLYAQIKNDPKVVSLGQDEKLQDLTTIAFKRYYTTEKQHPWIDPSKNRYFMESDILGHTDDYGGWAKTFDPGAGNVIVRSQTADSVGMSQYLQHSPGSWSSLFSRQRDLPVKFQFYKQQSLDSVGRYGDMWAFGDPLSPPTLGQTFNEIQQKIMGRINIGRQKANPTAATASGRAGDKALEEEFGIKIFRGGDSTELALTGHGDTMIENIQKTTLGHVNFATEGQYKTFFDPTMDVALSTDSQINRFARDITNTIQHENLHLILGKNITGAAGKAMDDIMYNQAYRTNYPHVSKSVEKGIPVVDPSVPLSKANAWDPSVVGIPTVQKLGGGEAGSYGIAQLDEVYGKPSVLEAPGDISYLRRVYELTSKTPLHSAGSQPGMGTVFEKTWERMRLGVVPIGGVTKGAKAFGGQTFNEGLSLNVLGTVSKTGGGAHLQTAGKEMVSVPMDSTMWKSIMETTAPGGKRQQERLNVFFRDSDDYLKVASDPFKTKEMVIPVRHQTSPTRMSTQFTISQMRQPSKYMSKAVARRVKGRLRYLKRREGDVPVEKTRMFADSGVIFPEQTMAFASDPNSVSRYVGAIGSGNIKMGKQPGIGNAPVSRYAQQETERANKGVEEVMAMYGIPSTKKTLKKVFEEGPAGGRNFYPEVPMKTLSGRKVGYLHMFEGIGGFEIHGSPVMKEIISAQKRLPKKTPRNIQTTNQTFIDPTAAPPLLRRLLKQDADMYKFARKQYRKEKTKEVAMRGMVIGGGLLGSKSMLAGSMGVIGAHNKKKQKQKFEDIWWRDDKAWNESFKTQPWR